MKLDFETDQGIGKRATFGLILLEADETLENEMRLMLPQSGAAIHHNRIKMAPQVTPETLASMEAELPKAAAMLPQIPFDVIGYGCTSGATIIGSAGIRAGINKVRPTAKVADPISAVISLCRHLGAKRLGFVTPYVADVSAAMRALLEENDFEIVSFASFEEGDDRVVARISPSSIMAAIKAVDTEAKCDAVFVSCTNLRVAGIADDAAKAIGKPVISSNTALAWQMMQLAGLSETVPGISH